MQLMNVERVHFLRAILNDPVLYVALAHDDIRLGRAHVVRLRTLPFDREHKNGRTIRVFRVLRDFCEIKMPRADGRDRTEPGQIRPWQWRGIAREPGS